VGIFGVVAASAAAWFISADQAQDRQRQADTITALTTELTALHQTVGELSTRVAAQPPPRQAAPSAAAETQEASSAAADILKAATCGSIPVPSPARTQISAGR
jgi:hypothetical protein